ncbi:MAG TPA: hypothetical protein VK967_02150 [Methylotenera sp.]|nr:hypothetical protein [Methylotenera sp.]
MKIREFIGLALLTAAFAITPFGYWLSVYWYFVALALAIPGAALFFTDRNTRKYNSSAALDADILPGPNGGLRGFHGSNAIDSFPDNSVGE